jgi:hypothetical protein
VCTQVVAALVAADRHRIGEHGGAASMVKVVSSTIV